MTLILNPRVLTKIDRLVAESTQQGVEVARSRMLPYTMFTMPEFKVNWHHRLVCKYLDAFATNKITRLMLFLQPRVSKSELSSRRLPSFLFGQNPDERIITASYGDSLASAMNRDVQRILESPRYQMLFPDVKLAGPGTDGNWVRNNSEFEIVGRRGRYYCSGVGGALTGLGGTTLLIDDPVKNEQEASSQVYRDHLYEWYTMVFRTRLENSNGPGRILLTMTRWHEDDLAGRLIALAKADPKADQWHIVSIPAIREDLTNSEDPRKLGEALWPEAMPLSELEKIKASSRRAFASLYQQRPAPEEGNVVKRQWWKFYTVAPQMDTIVQSWDLTFKGGKHSDFVVGEVWGRSGANKYLLDQVRARMSFNDALIAMVTLSSKWPQAIAKYVEDAANAAALIDTLKSRVPGIIPVRPKGEKAARAKAVSPQIEAGNIFLPEPEIAPWIHDFIEEWAVFPFGANDDQVDTSSQAISKLTDSVTFDWAPVSMTKVSTWNR